MPRCLLFDCDGTLVDSELLNCEAMSAELAQEGVKEEAQSLFRRYKGHNFYKVLDDLQLRHGVQLNDQFTDRFRNRAYQHFSENLQPVSGVPEALEKIQQPRFVVSNAPLKKIEHELKLTGLASYFGPRHYSAYDVGHWKPDPGLFLHAAEIEGYAAADCVVIEDSPVGVQAALSAGMPVILYDSLQSHPSAGATVTIRSMHDLPDALSDL